MIPIKDKVLSISCFMQYMQRIKCHPSITMGDPGSKAGLKCADCSVTKPTSFV